MQFRTLLRSIKVSNGVTVMTLMGVLAGAATTEANDNDRYFADPRIRRGFELAPVELNLRGKDPDLIGLGSYLINAVGGCNDCHTADPATEFAPGGNPFFGQPKVINQATYLGGGRNFGPLAPNTPDIVSRNLTPDKTGRPEGGRTFAEFLHIMKTGEDLDNVHPNCSAGVTGNCFPKSLPFDGNLLQIMPWWLFQGMTDQELRAIYEYLSAIPCVAGPPAPSVLHNDCT
jgi:hypothetical protein